MAAPEQRADSLITQINVTPLVDVVLVLLIIFMATAPLIQRRAIGVNVPKAATGEKATAALQVFFNADQKILLEKTPQTLESLTLALKERKVLEPDLRVSLSADGALPYNRVIEVLDAVRASGVSKVALEVNPRAKPKP